ncbi:protein adenylyltransferase SelO [Roseinatronobacter alkalisoli]|uniref:Protein nucleotidyltransferase YdiU n=1 Tax=Roseinatronobacter alkalisoli TaxID=3028235 RepID=A0ABT5T8H6_9RHOB|nr:YdiU family protein [Roseinatronobacter sp. HJB301]MDD7971426.1 YdiU family protein [Roseinatronobacter sp. HJB301]
MPLTLDHSYARDLQGLYVPWQGQDWPDPQILLRNDALARTLGLDPDTLDAGLLTGHALPGSARPLAMAYAGHQFGGFSPQLGDGRAILLGEVLDETGARWDIHLKGSGRTPFARGGDGRAVLGPVLREYLISESMAALGVPTTRALAACTTGDRVLRQNGLEPGAVLARVAASHLRVGTFQFFAARGDAQKLRLLADYAIARHDPDLTDTPDCYVQFLHRVAARQAQTVAQWMGLGFVHGVMNTDNTTISGETIDYGPCAFMDRYDPATVFSSIDHQGRYAYGNQPAIIFWNLARLAEALLPLIDADEDRAIARATEVIAQAQDSYRAAWLGVFARKLGLAAPDAALIDGMHQLWLGQGVDFTGFFRALPDALRGDEHALRALFDDAEGLDPWLASYRAAADADTPDRVAAANPLYIPRNHLVEAALNAATDGDMGPFMALLARVQAPFTPIDGAEDYAHPAPRDAPELVTFCGT